MAKASLKENDAVQLAGTKFTGTIASIDGATANVTWDDESAGLSKKVDLAALEPAKKKKSK